MNLGSSKTLILISTFFLRLLRIILENRILLLGLNRVLVRLWLNSRLVLLWLIFYHNRLRLYCRNIIHNWLDLLGLVIL